MKKQLQLLLFVSLGLLSLNSCSDDDSDSNVTDGDLLGTWEMVEFGYSGDSVTEFEGNEFTTEYSAMGENIDATMTFTEQPNELLFSGSYDIDLTFSFAGETQSQTVSLNDVEAVSIWSRSGNTLTIEGDFVTVEGTDLGETEIQDYTIEELTDSSLILTGSFTQIVDNEGVSSTVTIDTFIRFTR